MAPVTIELATTPAWAEAFRLARDGWPASVVLDVVAVGNQWPPADEHGDGVLVRAVATGQSMAVEPPTSRPGSAHATIVGAEPMHAASFSAWAQRALLGTANPAIDGVLSWMLPHDVTELDLPSDARASHHARTAVRNVAEGLSCIDDVLLATSELTANALQHGGGAPHLTTVRGDHSIVVALTDHRPDVWPVVLPMRGTVASSGRGMAIVEAISAHWGVTVYHDRKVVWCELIGH